MDHMDLAIRMHACIAQTKPNLGTQPNIGKKYNAWDILDPSYYAPPSP